MRVFPLGRVRAALVLVLVLCVTGAVASPSAGDDKNDLKQRRNDVSSDINGARSELEASSAQLSRATQALQTAQNSLAAARATLATTRTQLAAAQKRDAQMQQALDEAEDELDDAKAEAKKGRKRTRRAERVVERTTVESLQSGSPSLRAFSAIVNGVDPGAYAQQISLDTAMTEARLAQGDQLEATQVMLDLTRERVREARDDVKVKREAAADNLELQEELTAQAEAQEAEVSSLVQQTASARSVASEAMESDASRLQSLETERSRISTRLKTIAVREARAAAREQAAQERKRRQEERKKRRQEAASSGGSSTSGGGGGGGGSSSSGGSSSGGGGGGGSSSSGGGGDSGLSYPVSGPITSSYGMRYHPILHVWKLHDGTDFGVGCGTPIKAAASGTVIEAYYNSGYGNRVIITHGYMRGGSIATTYNHMSSFSTYVGEHVSRGETIGYVGSTGYSTGCHLHFMVLKNGDTRDPMEWL